MEQETPEIRRRILTAALQAMCAVGYEGASTREIAARSGVTQSLLRYYFRTKEDLWFALVGDLMNTFNADLAKALEGIEDNDPTSILRVIIERMVRMGATTPGFHRITLLESTQNSPRLKWLMEEHFQTFYEYLIKLIEDGQARGEVRKVDSMRLAYGIPTLIGGFFLASHQLEMLSGRDLLLPQELEQTIAVVHAFVFADAAK